MTEPYRELLLGAGHSRRKQYCASPLHSQAWKSAQGVVTLDKNPRTKPDLWCDLDHAGPWVAYPRKDPVHDPEGLRPYGTQIEMRADYWDEIHAYQVLEHLGSLGDVEAFFQFLQ